MRQCFTEVVISKHLSDVISTTLFRAFHFLRHDTEPEI